MKRGIAILFLVLLIPALSALSVEMKTSYSQGETIISKISGSVSDSLGEENILFYRQRSDGNGYLKIPIDYDLGKIDDVYYLRASLIGKEAGNYSLIIKNAYYYSGGKLTNAEIVRNFTINSNTALFSVSPAFFSTDKNFSTYVQGLYGSSSVSVSVPSGISSVSSVVLSSGQTKKISFNTAGLTLTTSSTITLSSDGLSYALPFKFFYTPPPQPPTQPGCIYNADCGNGYECKDQTCVAKPPQPYCGDDLVNVPGETCDGSDLSGLSCAAYGFNAGEISCNPPGTTNECSIDISNCYTQSTLECTKDGDCTKQDQICGDNKCITPTPEPGEIPCGNSLIDPGELCDGTTWGGVSSCLNFGFDNGTLSCSGSCVFNTQNCFDNLVEESEPECSWLKSCSDGFTCQNKKCIPEPPVDCRYDNDCGSQFFKCVENECILKDECTKNTDCDGLFEICESNRCTLEIGGECDRTSDCGEGYECALGFCEERIECRYNSECGIGEWCDEDKCIQREECVEDRDCDDDEECKDNFCVSLERECEEDTDCRNGYECVSNECFKKPAGCVNSSECKTDELCISNKCFQKVSDTDEVDPKISKTCSDKKGEICSSTEECDGAAQTIGRNICCLGSCKSVSPSSNTKIIGWVIIGVIGIFILWFFKRYKSKTKATPSFLKK